MTNIHHHMREQARITRLTALGRAELLRRRQAYKATGLDTRDIDKALQQLKKE